MAVLKRHRDLHPLQRSLIQPCHLAPNQGLAAYPSAAEYYFLMALSVSQLAGKELSWPLELIIYKLNSKFWF